MHKANFGEMVAAVKDCAVIRSDPPAETAANARPEAGVQIAAEMARYVVTRKGQGSVGSQASNAASLRQVSAPPVVALVKLVVVKVVATTPVLSAIKTVV